MSERPSLGDIVRVRSVLKALSQHSNADAVQFANTAIEIGDYCSAKARDFTPLFIFLYDAACLLNPYQGKKRCRTQCRIAAYAHKSQPAALAYTFYLLSEGLHTQAVLPPLTYE